MGKNITWWILWGVVIVALILVIGWAVLRLIGSDRGASRPQAVIWRGEAAELTLADAVQRGNARAQQWAADAVLVKAEASWQPGANWSQVQIPPVAWSFYYYSPAQQAIASAGVGATEIFWVPPVPTGIAMQPLTQCPPPQGIEVAWLSLRAAGGATFLQQHPEALINFGVLQKGATLLWIASAAEKNAHIAVEIDAQSGIVLSAPAQ